MLSSLKNTEKSDRIIAFQSAEDKKKPRVKVNVKQIGESNRHKERTHK